MSLSPNEKFPGATEADPNYKDSKFKDNNPSTTNNGTPLKAIDRNEQLALQEAVMNAAGFDYNGVVDTPQNSQMFAAYKAALSNGANLLSNHNFIIASPDDSQPAPSATPTSYPPGYEIFSGVFANETTGILNLTYIDGRVSFSGGDFYIPRANSKELENITEFVASVADFDGKPRTRGVSYALVGDEYRVTVGVDALEDESATLTPLGSVKFERGSVATGHEVDYWVVASGSIAPRSLEERFAEIGNLADEGLSSGDISSGVESALSKNSKLIINEGSYSVSSPPLTPVNSNIKGSGNTKTVINLTSSFIDNDGTSNSDTSLSNIGFIGSGKSDGVTAIKRDGTVNSSREEFKSISIDDCEVGIKNSAGWNQDFNQLFIRNCGSGFLGAESPILSGWGSSGYVMTNCYFGGNDVGIDDNNMWNATYINPIIENNGIGYKQDTRGTPTVMINPWFEDNVSNPEWRRPTVVLGGRDVNFDDVALFSGDPTRAIGHFYGSLRIFRNAAGLNDRLFVDGEGVKAFKAVYSSLGWAYEEITSSISDKMMKVSQGDAFGTVKTGALTSTDPLVTFGARVHETGGAIDTMPTTGVKIEGSIASGRGFVRPVLQSGVYFGDGNPSNDIGDRWRLEWTGEFIPVLDSTYDIGTSSNRVNDMFIVNAPTTGSDARIKTDVRSMSQELLDFALTVEIKHWKFKDGVRSHSGIVITEEFIESLNKVMAIDDCAAICHTVFRDEEGNPVTSRLHGVELGDFWQVRQDEWQNILLEAMRRKVVAM
jgi:hypothetical protein